MLVLFDIDGTLLRTGGLGRDIMQRAGSAVLGRQITLESMDFSGRLDPLILTDLLELNDAEAHPKHLASMRDRYVALMTEAISASGQVQALSGAHEFVDAVESLEHATLGVLTGNFAPTGEAKLRAAGWDPERFAVRVWGDESPAHPPSRDQLPGVALQRYGDLHGAALPGERAVVVGDTVHDVACARAHGCRVIAVATGTFGLRELVDAGADLVVDSLDDTAMLMDAILGWAPASHG